MTYDSNAEPFDELNCRKGGELSKYTPTLDVRARDLRECVMIRTRNLRLRRPGIYVQNPANQPALNIVNITFSFFLQGLCAGFRALEFCASFRA